MNIPTATDAKTATIENRARKQQAALDEQAALIEQRIQECVAEGKYGFSQVGRLDHKFRTLLCQKGYDWHQYNEHRDDSYYTIQWETPRLRTL
jgi:hypothetical protein